MSSLIPPSRPVIRPATEADRGDLRRFFAGCLNLWVPETWPMPLTC